MHEIIDLMNEMSPYLLLGFLLAGLMRAFVPTHLYHRYLGQPNFRSVLNAMLLSLPVPLCSCGVIPTAMSLYRQGASKADQVRRCVVLSGDAKVTIDGFKYNNAKTPIDVAPESTLVIDGEVQ